MILCVLNVAVNLFEATFGMASTAYPTLVEEPACWFCSAAQASTGTMVPDRMKTRSAVMACGGRP